MAVFDREAVFGQISAVDAVALVTEAFFHFAAGDWTMPAKVYLDCAPHGDLRAMPASSGDLAILKWIGSFPSNSERQLPTVEGIVCVNNATTGQLIALVDGTAVTALRTGAVAAVATKALARGSAATVGLIGCGLNGAWAARCLKETGYAAGVCFDTRPDAASALASELGWTAGTKKEALACDVVTVCTPGAAPVVHSDDLREGMHFNGLGADGPGKSEFSLDALQKMRLFCDQWEQASHGGEIAAAVDEGLVGRDACTELGDVLTDRRSGRRSDSDITFFDSTGLAIQDLAIARGLLKLDGKS